MRLPRLSTATVARSLGLHAARPMSRDKADTLLLLAACTLVLLPHAFHLPGWIFPACVALLAWRGWITFNGLRMPPRRWLLPVALLAMAGVYATYQTLLGREAGVAMLALLLALKLLEMHAKRDLFVALFLSFFLVLTGFFHSQSIVTALVTVAAVVMLLTAQVSFQYTGVVPPLARRLRLSALILALAVPVTLVLFLLFPRIQGPLWRLPGDAHSSRTGLSDTMAPGAISRLALSDDIAFRVDFSDPPPPQHKLYWRGVVLDKYDGRIWSPLPAGVTARTAVALHGEPVRYQVTLEPHSRHWLFALDVPQAAPRIADNTTGLSHDMQLLASQPINARTRYRALSHVEYTLQSHLPAAALQRWLALPPGFNPRTLAFAARLRARPGSDADMVAAVLRHFREQDFRYTLEPPLLGRHGVDEFLFDTRAGFCEHYAGAFVVLMRALGIPARVVTGYQGGEINPADGFLTVRQSDAHAWAEIWLGQRGWVRIDPTAAVAPERVQRGLADAIPRPLPGLFDFSGYGSAWAAQWFRLRHNWEALNNAWNQWVLDYTPARQRDFLQRLGFARTDWRTMVPVMAVLGIAALCIAAVPLLPRRKKRDPVNALYQSLCDRLARQGLPRAPHEGPRAYGARLTGSASPLPAARKEALARFLACYENLRYGAADPLHHTAVSRLKSLLAECR